MSKTQNNVPANPAQPEAPKTETTPREKKPGYLTLEKLAAGKFVDWNSQSITVVRFEEDQSPVMEMVLLEDLIHLTPANIQTVANQYDSKAKENQKIRAVASQLRALGLVEEAEKVLLKLK